MASPTDDDQLALVNTVLAARRYYLDGANKSEIALELGLTRWKVARLLDDAIRNGVVRIEIDSVPQVDEVLSRELAVAHGIRSAIVVRTIDGPSEFQRAQLGRAVAKVLSDALEESDVIGISWGRTLHAMVGQFPRLPGCEVVQLVGIVPSLELNVNTLELVRRLGSRTGGDVHFLHVPLIVQNATVAASLRSDPHVRQTLDLFPRVTRAIVGIGAWAPDGSTVRTSLSSADAEAVDRAGAIADCCSILLDADGNEVRAAGIPERCIAIRSDELRAIPDVVAVSGGEGKVDAIRAALRSGLVHRLVTTEVTARLLLDGGRRGRRS